MQLTLLAQIFLQTQTSHKILLQIPVVGPLEQLMYIINWYTPHYNHISTYS